MKSESIDYITVLLEVSSNPDGLIIQKSLAYLQRFMSGYRNGVSIVGIKPDEGLEIWSDFEAAVHRGTGENGTVYECFYRHNYDDSEAWRDMIAELQKFVVAKNLSLEPDVTKTQVVRIKLFNDIMAGLFMRPFLYLNAPSISYLAQFMNGLLYAIRRHCVDNSIEQRMHEFERWVQRERSVHPLMRWDRVLLINSGFNEEGAFQRFKDSYGAFTNENTTP